MTMLQIMSPLEWFAFVGMPFILVTMGWLSVKANESWLARERVREKARVHRRP